MPSLPTLASALALVLLALSPATLPAQTNEILISEFMASNSASLTDEDGDHPDWIELYNNTGAPVDLGGWFLTDNPDAPTKWQIPARILAARRTLIIFASGKNRTASELHTNFALAASGEYLALVKPDGTTVSHAYAPMFPQQVSDISYGIAMTTTSATLASQGASARYLVPSDGSLATTWTAPGFDDSAWPAASTGIGFDDSGQLDPFIGTDIGPAMQNVNPGAYLRVPFTPPASILPIDDLRLDLRFDDGAVAYINGTLVATSNAPDSPAWDAAAPSDGQGFTVDDFAPPEPSYQLVNFSGPAATIQTGPGSDRFVRLAYNGQGNTRNAIHFERAIVGAPERLVSEFDFRMNGTADGFAFVLLPTSQYGTDTSTAPPNTSEEPNIGATFAVGFDIHSNIDEVSLHFGTTRAETNLSGTIDINSGAWHRARIEIAPATGSGSLVSVSVTPNVRTTPGTPVVFHDEVSIAEFNPYESRLQFAARTGGLTSDVDIDRISVFPGTGDGTSFLAVPLSDQTDLVTPGTNVIAIHGLNSSADDPDFLALPELTALHIDSVDPDPANAAYYTAPSPGAPNTAGLVGFAGPVTISPPASTFTTTQSVTLSADPDATIRFTLDGSVPTESSPAYSAPLALANSATLRVRAFGTGLVPGPVNSGVFLRIGPSAQSFTSDLPVVIVDNFNGGTPPAPNSSGTFQPAAITIFEPDAATGRTSIVGEPVLANRLGIRRRGSSTLDQPKPNLRMEFWDESDEDRRLAPLGMSADGDWILYAPYNFDRAFVRNAFVYDLAKTMGLEAVRTRFVEVFFNSDGSAIDTSTDYHGIYVFMERVEVGNDRLDIAKLDAEDIAEPEVTGGYLWKIDRTGPGESSFSAGGQGSQVLVEPDQFVIQPQQDAYLKGYINSFGSALNGANFTHPTLGYEAFIDIPSFVDNHILNVYAFNVDAFRLSNYLFKPRNGKIHEGPVWDFDRSLESYDNRDDNPQQWGDTGGTNFFHYGWYNRLFDDPDFGQAWIDRWAELRDGPLSDAGSTALLSSMEAELTEAAPRNYARWTGAPPSNGGSLAGEIDNIEDWLALRTAWIDDQLVARPQHRIDGAPFAPGVYSVPAGSSLTFATEAGATTYFQTDGTEPRAGGGLIAGGASTGSTTLDSSAQVRARSRNTGNTSPLFDTRWSAPATATFLVGQEPALPTNLAVTELHYHPRNPSAAESAAGFIEDDFEFIELLNTGSMPIDLVDAALTDGVNLAFPFGSVIPVGGRAIISKNPDAFLMRYGDPPAGVPLIGGYENVFSNSSEQVELRAWNDTIIAQFTYSDDWLKPTDGTGYSLEAVAQDGTPSDLSQPASWAISCEIGGSPGLEATVFATIFDGWLNSRFTPAEIADPSISGHLADPDRDGIPNLIEYALGLDPRAPDASQLPTATLNASGQLEFAVRQLPKALDLSYSPVVSSDLATWTPMASIVGAPTPNGDGTETVTYADTAAPDGSPRRFVRLEVVQSNP
ncbi:hypothetical protein BH23VER1_BH23VER1_31570 [soil metagenome]